MSDIEPRRSRQGGLTLIEMMIVIVIAGIMLTIAIPSFRDVLQRNRMTSVLNDLVLAMQSARSEAIKQNRATVLCASTDGTACDGAGWDDGWIVWVDSDEDGAVDAGEVVAMGEAPDGFSFDGLASPISFLPSGAASTSGTITACIGGDYEGALDLELTGRPIAKSIHPPVNCP